MSQKKNIVSKYICIDKKGQCADISVLFDKTLKGKPPRVWESLASLEEERNRIAEASGELWDITFSLARVPFSAPFSEYLPKIEGREDEL